MGSHLLRCKVCGYEKRKSEAGFTGPEAGLTALYGHISGSSFTLCQSDEPGIKADLTMVVVPGTWEPE